MSRIYFHSPEQESALRGSERAYASCLMRDNMEAVLGKPYLFDLSLEANTMLAMGNDVMTLLTRLHAQCEIYCYVEGPNREWFAKIIEKGRRRNILRAAVGWEDVIEHLRLTDQTPVVCSYSVCESFPNSSILDMSDEDYDNLDRDDAFDCCMKMLRESDDRLEMRPDEWEFDAFYFGNGLTAYDMMANPDAHR